MGLSCPNSQQLIHKAKGIKVKRKRGTFELPKSIDTELGVAFLEIVPARRAIKQYQCPLCPETIEIAEEHVFIAPEQVYALRRHAHLDCVQHYITNKIPITLHPNDKRLAVNYIVQGNGNKIQR